MILSAGVQAVKVLSLATAEVAWLQGYSIVFKRYGRYKA